MTSEPVVDVVFVRPVEGKMNFSYICLPFHSPTHASQLTGTSSYYRFRCHYPLITYLMPCNVLPLHFKQTFLSKIWDERIYESMPSIVLPFTPQANFPAHNLNLHWRWRWWIESRLPFKIFPTLSDL